MQVTVVSHCNGRLTELVSAFENIGQLVSAVQEAVLGVQMEVNEVRHEQQKKRDFSGASGRPNQNQESLTCLKLGLKIH